jgi:hypothetical protein
MKESANRANSMYNVDMKEEMHGKITTREERLAMLLKWLPWLSLLIIAIPAPLFFFILFLTATVTESAALFLLLIFASFGAGCAAAIVTAILLLLYRKRWLERLRDRLAADGITADEVRWFAPELTSAEREALAGMKQHNPLLADAFSETLAARLTATRVLTKTKRELLQVERRINRARGLKGADTSSLRTELESDRKRLDEIRQRANSSLAEAKARLQLIEAAASREYSQTETDLMLQRLTAAQEHLPLAIEMARMELRLKEATELDQEPS